MREPQEPGINEENPEASLLKGACRSFGGKLDRGNHLKLHPEIPLAQHNNKTLDALVVMGDTVCAVVKRYDDAQSHERQVVGVDLVALPMGLAGGKLTDAQMPGAIVSVDVEALSQTQPGGYEQHWQKVAVGREDLRQAVGASEYREDKTVSREHLELTVHSDGMIEIVDTSTNGTFVLRGQDIMRNSTTENRHAMEDLAETVLLPLSKNPQLWSGERGFADVPEGQTSAGENAPHAGFIDRTPWSVAGSGQDAIQPATPRSGGGRYGFGTVPVAGEDVGPVAIRGGVATRTLDILPDGRVAKP